MRRLLCLGLLSALLAPAAAWAGPTAPPEDGTLSLRNADGGIYLKLRGVAIGRLGSGTLEIELLGEQDCADLNVWGDEDGPRDFIRFRETGELLTICRFAGKRIRFRLSGAPLTLRIKWGRNVNLSAVGTGAGTLNGLGGLNDGLYALNGAPYASLPDLLTPIVIVPPRRVD